MTLDEVSLRAAINVLRDSVESKRMPSGSPLDGEGLALHDQTIAHLQGVLVRIQAHQAYGASR